MLIIWVILQWNYNLCIGDSFTKRTYYDFRSIKYSGHRNY